jgi:hypothetical protein
MKVRGMIWPDYHEVWGNLALLPKEHFPDVAIHHSPLPALLGISSGCSGTLLSSPGSTMISEETWLSHAMQNQEAEGVQQDH